MGNRQRTAEREPFGVTTGAFAKVAEEVNLALRDHCDLDRSGVGPRTAIEKYFQRVSMSFASGAGPEHS